MELALDEPPTDGAVETFGTFILLDFGKVPDVAPDCFPALSAASFA